MKSVSRRAFTLIELLVVVAIIGILAAILLPTLARAKVKGKRIACLNNCKQMGMGSQMFSEDQPDGRLTGSLKLTPNEQQADDDMNWLFPHYVKNLQTFVCPSTRHEIGTNTYTVAYKGQLLTKLRDLDDNAPTNRNARGYSNGHSYEVFGNWHNGAAGFPRKTVSSVLVYAHQHPASPLKGVVAGPADTWIIVDAMEPRPAPWNHENWPNPYDGHGTAGGNVVFADGHAEWIHQSKWNYRYELSEDNGRTINPF